MLQKISVMEYKAIALFMVTLNVVWGSICGFEDLSTLFDGSLGQCDTEETWNFSHTSANFGNKNDVGNFFTPGTSSSCITSHTLPLAHGGVIEINVYIKSIQSEDYVSVTIYEAVENKIVGKATLSPKDDRVEDGWNILKIILDGNGNYDGYVMVMGGASTDSVILLDSVCYTSPPVDDKLQESDGILKLTSNDRAPDVYVLQSHSVFKQLVNPIEVVATEIEMNDGTISGNRAVRLIDFDDFWTPLTISLAVIIPVLILSLLGWGCFAMGKRKGANQEPEIIYEDVNTIPKPYLVPRVKSVYTESGAGSTYGGRNNNIYSV